MAPAKKKKGGKSKTQRQFVEKVMRQKNYEYVVGKCCVLISQL